MEEHHIIGTIVIIVIIIAASFGMFLVAKQMPGRAIETLDSGHIGYYCYCIKDKQSLKAFYTMQDFAIANEKEISIPKAKNTQDPCGEVCASLGGYAK